MEKYKERKNINSHREIVYNKLKIETNQHNTVTN